jgi:uncharacterized protein (TIGR00255 family)
MKKLKSMTGYASVQARFNETELTCEMRSLNSRYLEIALKLPKILNDLENPIKDIIRNKITRGKIFCSINFSSLNGELQNLKIDKYTVKTYLKLLEQIKQISEIDSPITLEHLLFFKDIISFDEDNTIDEELTNLIYETVEKAISSLNEMKAQEGENLRADFEERLDKIKGLNSEISNLAAENPKIEFEKLYKRLLTYMEEENVDQTRLEQEIALIADRVDITEETVRMNSHLKLFKENLKNGSPIGKKLNFILQEMHRESNTISNKNTLVEISHRVVAIKEEIEKLREQIQNIE